MQLRGPSLQFVISILLIAMHAGGNAAAAGRTKAPAERMLAGYSTEKHGQVVFRDARTGYYLLRNTECDGSHVKLVLSHDPAVLKGWGVSVDGPATTGDLRSLTTGRGIRIGDSRARVQQIMGSPTWQGTSKFTRWERAWSYHRLFGTQTDGVEYITLFRFRNGLVTGIELDRELRPG